MLLVETALSKEPFAGRERELKHIAHIFENGAGPAIICGIGGIGKTVLAKAYALKNEDRYSRIFFLTHEGSLERLISNDSTIRIKDMEYRADIYKTRRRYANAKLKVLKRILSAEKALIIIDDWNRPEGKLEEAVLSLPCDIIVTTRLAPELWSSGSAFLLKELATGKEWEEFYQLYAAPVDDAADKALKKLFEARRREVNGHTLSMKLFAAEMNSGRTLRIKPVKAEMNSGRTLRIKPVKTEMSTSSSHLEKPAQQPTGDPVALGRNPSKDSLLDRFTLKKQELGALAALSVMPTEGLSEPRFLKISGTDSRTLKRLKSLLLIQTDRQTAGEDGTAISLHPVIAEKERIRRIEQKLRSIRNDSDETHG